MKRRLVIMAAVVILGAMGFLGWHLISPLFLSNRVVEALPAGLAASSTPGAGGTQPATGVPAIKKGNLKDADGFHKGSGEVAVYRLSGGKLLLRLESINVTNGPDLHVYLSAHPNPATSAEVHQPGYADLGKLKANQGSQNYDIAAGVELSAIRSVVIYCQPFSVIFSTATLE
ncbi:MAG: hypothetical protein EXR51_01545 [Dehalococcoidia bacterium]|nr:hypothetical protein [Dehalococcoidia bacterium]